MGLAAIPHMLPILTSWAFVVFWAAELHREPSPYFLRSVFCALLYLIICCTRVSSCMVTQ